MASLLPTLLRLKKPSVTRVMPVTGSTARTSFSLNSRRLYGENGPRIVKRSAGMRILLGKVIKFIE